MSNKHFYFYFYFVSVWLHSNTVVGLIFSWTDHDVVHWDWESDSQWVHPFIAEQQLPSSSKVHFQRRCCVKTADLMSACTTGLEQRNRHNSHYTRLNLMHRRHFASIGCVVCCVQCAKHPSILAAALSTSDETEKHLLVFLTLWTSCSFRELLHLVRESLADVAECVWSTNWLTPETATCWNQ